MFEPPVAASFTTAVRSNGLPETGAVGDVATSDTTGARNRGTGEHTAAARDHDEIDDLPFHGVGAGVLHERDQRIRQLGPRRSTLVVAGHDRQREWTDCLVRIDGSDTRGEYQQPGEPGKRGETHNSS